MTTNPIVFQLDASETDRWFSEDADTSQRDLFRWAIRAKATELAKAAGAASFKIKASNGNLCATAAVPQKPAPLRKARAAADGEPPPYRRRNLTADEATALRAYAAYHGRYWKRDLAVDWQCACADLYPVNLRATMQGLRNSHGPAWLTAYRFPR